MIGKERKGHPEGLNGVGGRAGSVGQEGFTEKVALKLRPSVISPGMQREKDTLSRGSGMSKGAEAGRSCSSRFRIIDGIPESNESQAGVASTSGSGRVPCTHHATLHS